MTQTKEDAVLKTVLFWSDKSFRTRLNQNNGDDSLEGGLVFRLMNMISENAQDQLTDEKIKQFENFLTISLMESPLPVILECDYHPCSILRTCAELAGIDSSCFPCKTFTRIDLNHEVTAKYQYGGQFVKL